MKEPFQRYLRCLSITDFKLISFKILEALNAISFVCWIRCFKIFKWELKAIKNLNIILSAIRVSTISKSVSLCLFLEA